MKLSTGLAFFLTGVIGTSYASSNVASATSIAPVMNKTTTLNIASTPVVTPKAFSIPANTPLSVQLLDNCWHNRENLTNQQIIAGYLMTQPQVPNNYEIAWKTARLVYFIGNYGSGEKQFVNTSDGVTLFNYGAQAGKLAKSLNPNAVEGYYWYAIDLGSYGLAKGILSAASNAGDGMAALNRANQINPSYQWYGSDRILGRYYQELPGIFGGDSQKALALFTEAVTKAPNFKNNWVFLGQYYLSTSQYDKALEVCKKAYNMMPLDGKYEEMRYTREAKECAIKAYSKLS